MRLMLNGKLPTEDELKADELIAQMLQTAEEKGKTSVKVPTTAEIMQSVKAEDLKDVPVVKQMVDGAVEEIKKAVEPKAIIQAATKDDLKEHPVVLGMIDEAVKQVKFTAETIAAIGGAAQVAGTEGGKKSALRTLRETDALI